MIIAAPAAHAYAMMYCLQGQAYVVTCSGPNNDDCWTNAAGGCVGSWAIELDASAIVPSTPEGGSIRNPVRQTASLLHDWRPDPKSWTRPSDRFMSSLRSQGVQGRLSVPASRLAPYVPDRAALGSMTAAATPGTGFGGASGGVPPRSVQPSTSIRAGETATPPSGAPTPR